MGEALNKILGGVKQAPEAVKNHVKKHPVIYGVITALFFATLFLTGVGGAMALVGGHAAFAPHFMSAMNTAISGAWSGLPYAMTAAGGVGGAGLIGTAIAAIIIGGKKYIASRKPKCVIKPGENKQEIPNDNKTEVKKKGKREVDAGEFWKDLLNQPNSSDEETDSQTNSSDEETDSQSEY